jgi:hypothetical protein
MSSKVAFCTLPALFATSAAAQPFDDDGLGWGPHYNNHLSPYNGRPLGPPLSALPPGRNITTACLGPGTS